MVSLKNIITTLFAATAAAVVMSACGDGLVYDHYNHTSLTGWDKSDTLTFDIPPIALSGRYRQEIGLRINESYPFKSIAFVVEQTAEPGHRHTTDTLRCRLADDKGNHTGQGVSYYQYDFILSEVNLNEGDSLHISVRHAMKREVLPGIADIGLRLRLIR